MYQTQRSKEQSQPVFVLSNMLSGKQERDCKNLRQRISLTRNKIEKQILRQQLQQSFIKCIREEAESTKNYVMFCIHQEYLKKVNDTRKVIKTLISRLHQQQGLSEPSTIATAKPCNWHILFMHQGLLEPTTTAKAKSCNWHIFFMHQGLHTKKCKRKEKKSWCLHLKKVCRITGYLSLPKGHY